MNEPVKSRNSLTRWGNWPIPILCVLLLGQMVFTFGASHRDDLEWFDPLIDVRGMVLEDFVEKPDPEKMRNAAISSMLETLDDPYTIWIPPADEEDFEKQMRGSYVGIGAEIVIADDRLNIVTPLENSPAMQAGIKAGDVVMKIAGEDTLGLSSSECIDRLLGEEGTPVELVVRHLDGEEETVEVIRRRIRTRTVKGIERDGQDWIHMLDPEEKIGYIRLTQFTERTAQELREVVNALEADGVKGLILDLRFNGGGTLDGAIDVSDLFLERGAIVSVRDRRGQGRAWTAQTEPDDVDIPMVVLVNESSASASEIVAGALQENGRAKVLGERTFGKGSVQQVRPLSNGRGTLKLTTARYYLPSGRNIDRAGDNQLWGVDPDPGFAMDLTGSEYSDLYEARRDYEIIVDKEASRHGQWSDPAWIEKEMKDPQLAAALKTLEHRLNRNEWLEVGGVSDAGAIRSAELIDQLAYRDRLLEELVEATDRINELETTEGEEEVVPMELGNLGSGPIELRNADGETIMRFKAEDLPLLEKALRAAGATADSTSPEAP